MRVAYDGSYLGGNAGGIGRDRLVLIDGGTVWEWEYLRVDGCGCISGGLS